MRKKFFSLLLVICMVMAAFPAVSLADYTGAATEGEKSVASITSGGTTYYYDTLAAAVADVPATEGSSATTITLLKDTTGGGIVVKANQNIIFELNNHTYSVTDPGVGSNRRTNLGFQLLNGSTVTFQNGTINVASNATGIQVLIQNYCDLTLQDANVDGSTNSSLPYVLSNNCGTVNILGSTSITAPEGALAFDVFYWPDGGYGVGVTVNVNTTGKITGRIEYGGTDAGRSGIATHATLNIQSGTIDGNIKTDNLATDATTSDRTTTGINITGGTFSTSVSEYVDPSLNAELVSSDGGKTTYRYYESVNAAKEAAGADDLVIDLAASQGSSKKAQIVAVGFRADKTEANTAATALQTKMGAPSTVSAISDCDDNTMYLGILGTGTETEYKITVTCGDETVHEGTNTTTGGTLYYFTFGREDHVGSFALKSGTYTVALSTADDTGTVLDTETITLSEVSYDLGEGGAMADMPASTYYTSGSTVSIVDGEPTKNGFDLFRGWSAIEQTDAKTALPISDNTFTVGNNPVAITAKWYGDTAEYPVEIAASAEGLQQFAAMAKADPGICGKLTANIVMSGQSWTPIGTKANPYTGTFDGGGYTISGLRVSSSSSGGYVGLFGCIGSEGTVQNVKLKSVSISASGKTGYAGGICGYNNGGTIANCTVTGTVSTCGQSGSSGGVCGYNAGTISGCTSSVKVTASGKSAYAGGICGYNAKAGTLTKCTNSGAVTTSGKSGKAGGICGYNAGTIKSCSNTGKIRATGQSGKSGKIYGYNSGKVS